MTDRARLQWASADWPEGGRFDSKGSLLGGQILLRLDLISAFQVRRNLFHQPQADRMTLTPALNNGLCVMYIRAKTPVLNNAHVSLFICTLHTAHLSIHVCLNLGMVSSCCVLWRLQMP